MLLCIQPNRYAIVYTAIGVVRGPPPDLNRCASSVGRASEGSARNKNLYYAYFAFNSVGAITVTRNIPVHWA